MDSSESVVETPWGSGAETPIHRPGLDEATLELMQARSGLVRRRSSHHTAESISTSRSVVKPPPAAASPLDLVARAALLFILGVGYGALVTRFHSETVVGGLHKGLSSSITTPSMDWKFQIFWGMSGVFLGAALPWADKMWKAEEDDEAVVETCVDAEEESSDDDWMSVMRPIAAFVGIFFAIVSFLHFSFFLFDEIILITILQRKLAWTSPLQIVFTLAATNPLLWWLIDRTVPGFFLSAFIGISGSAFLLGTNPSVIATPSGFSTLATHNMNSTMNVLANDNLVLGGLANQTTLEAGMWIASVLFCSCLCFGNIGRRLAQSSAGKS